MTDDVLCEVRVRLSVERLETWEDSPFYLYDLSESNFIALD